MVSITGTVILKALIVIIGLVVTILGCNAVLKSDLYENREDKLLIEGCEMLSQCPTDWLARERYFVAAAIITLMLSAVSLALGFIPNLTTDGIRVADGIYQIVGGIMILSASGLLIATALQLDVMFYDLIHGNIRISDATKYVTGVLDLKQGGWSPPTGTLDPVDWFRDSINFIEKLAAGGLGVVNGILYFVTACLIFRSKPSIN